MIESGDIVGGTHIFRLSAWQRLKVLFGCAVGVTIELTLVPDQQYPVTHVKAMSWVQRASRARTSAVARVDRMPL